MPRLHTPLSEPYGQVSKHTALQWLGVRGSASPHLADFALSHRPLLTSFGILVLSFLLGMRHATDADHVVAVTRTPLWAGIGIHWIFTGWVYNVSGRDAVELAKRDGSKVWIGSDEPARLAAAIESARTASGATSGAAPRSGSR